MLGHLLPCGMRLVSRRDGIESEKTIDGKTRGLMSKAVESGSKKSGDKEHKKTKCGLHGDEDVHQAATRARIFSASESACRPDSRGSQCGCEAQ